MLDSPFKKKLFLGILIASSCLSLTVYSVYRALTFQRREYYEVINQSEEYQLKNGHEFERKVLELQNNARLSEDWAAEFTLDEINGWLATQYLKRNENKKMLGQEIKRPRLLAYREGLQLYTQYHGSVGADLMINFQVSMTDEPNQLALSITGVYAGMWPLSMEKVTAEITRICQEMKLPLKWNKEGEHPVALITLPTEYQALPGRKIWLNVIELHESEEKLVLVNVYKEGKETQEEHSQKEYKIVLQGTTSLINE
ncbi:MAG: hypothetical protein MPJ24_00725 [Pirellulaceae bacterium]|nr:hypothetical protein [Pirellulaceae bacterium]